MILKSRNFTRLFFSLIISLHACVFDSLLNVGMKKTFIACLLSLLAS